MCLQNKIEEIIIFTVFYGIVVHLLVISGIQDLARDSKYFTSNAFLISEWIILYFSIRLLARNSTSFIQLRFKSYKKYLIHQFKELFSSIFFLSIGFFFISYIVLKLYVHKVPFEFNAYQAFCIFVFNVIQISFLIMLNTLNGIRVAQIVFLLLFSAQVILNYGEVNFPFMIFLSSEHVNISILSLGLSLAVSALGVLILWRVLRRKYEIS